MKRLITTTLFVLFLGWSVTPAVQAGACGQQSEVGLKRKVKAAVDAKLNPSDTDKTTGSIPAATEVTITFYRDVSGKAWYMVTWFDGKNKKAGWVKEDSLVCD